MTLRALAPAASLLAATLLAFAPASASEPAPGEGLALPAILASQHGSWSGKLEYLDYSANRWFGIPMTVEVRDGGDGVTQIRVADFDDGPKVGTVRITTISMLAGDGSTEYTTSFRKGRTPELTAARLELVEARDPAHWTIIAWRTGSDDDRPALIRETLTRDGDRMTALKEVDFTDDESASWLQRNRTTLERVAD